MKSPQRNESNFLSLKKVQVLCFLTSECGVSFLDFRFPPGPRWGTAFYQGSEARGRGLQGPGGPWIAQHRTLSIGSWDPQASDRKRAWVVSSSLARSLVLCFAVEPTYNVRVGGRLLDSPCVLEKGENEGTGRKSGNKNRPTGSRDLGRILEIIQIEPQGSAIKD